MQNGARPDVGNPMHQLRSDVRPSSPVRRRCSAVATHPLLVPQILVTELLLQTLGAMADQLVGILCASQANDPPQLSVVLKCASMAPMPFFQRGDVRIRYEEAGSGFPLLVTPGGGLNSRVDGWPGAVFNAMDAFQDEFRCITMDQRNAIGGESTGPVPVDDPWGAFAGDQLGLMDHLGIEQFLYMGYCIGGPFAFKLMQQAPDRVVASVLCQPVGHRPEDRDVMYNSGRDAWAPELRAQRPEITARTIESYLHNLYRAQPDFVYSVSRDFARSCPTPILVMPDDAPAHPYQTSMDVVALAPHAEVTPFPWADQPETLSQTIQQVRDFLHAHEPT